MSSFSPNDVRIIFIAEIDAFGGAERSVLALSSWLHQHNLPHYVLTYIDRYGLEQHAGHPVKIIELRPGEGARKKISALKRYFEQSRSSTLSPLVSGYQPALHATLAGIRGFHTLMHDTPSLFSDRQTRSIPGKLRIALSNAIISRGLRSGGKTIVTSEYLRSECRRDFSVNAAIVRMGGMTQLIRPRIRSAERELRMLSVSRIEANKRIDWMLRALSKMEAADVPLSFQIDWQLDVVGSGSLIPELSAMAVDLGISGRVCFRGFLNDGELAALYERTHLFLMPAIQGYGIPAIEALARGIPVLIHRDSGVSDILLDTPWATVFDGEEPEMGGALQTAINKVMIGAHHATPLPQLPTEDSWAEQAATLCGWA